LVIACLNGGIEVWDSLYPDSSIGVWNLRKDVEPRRRHVENYGALAAATPFKMSRT
jgi:hypothetical protein